jgi:hypothetical protein
MIEVFENFLSKEEQIKLQEIVFSSNFGWYWAENSSYDPTVEPNDIAFKELINLSSKYSEFPQFCHVLLDNHIINSNYFHLFFEIILSKLVRKTDSLFRAKINLNIPFQTFGKNSIGVPHVDCSDFSYKSLIYYINDSDGDTVFFDKKFGNKLDNLNIEKTITPKSGTMVIFDSNHIHSASLPFLSNKRAVLNVVYKKESVG